MCVIRKLLFPPPIVEDKNVEAREDLDRSYIAIYSPNFEESDDSDEAIFYAMFTKEWPVEGEVHSEEPGTEPVSDHHSPDALPTNTQEKAPSDGAIQSSESGTRTGMVTPIVAPNELLSKKYHVAYPMPNMDPPPRIAVLLLHETQEYGSSYEPYSGIVYTSNSVDRDDREHIILLSSDVHEDEEFFVKKSIQQIQRSLRYGKNTVIFYSRYAPVPSSLQEFLGVHDIPLVYRASSDTSLAQVTEFPTLKADVLLDRVSSMDSLRAFLREAEEQARTKHFAVVAVRMSSLVDRVVRSWLSGLDAKGIDIASIEDIVNFVYVVR